jgi:hypothetical protein
MVAFVDEKTKNWLNRETSRRGLEDLGYIVEFATVDTVICQTDLVYYGNVNFIEKVVDTLGYTHNPIAHVPEELQLFAGRKIERMTLEEALEKSRFEKIFIKPKPEKHKHFTGMVLKTPMDMVHLANYPNTDEVLVSPAIDILSEWRCFIHGNEVLDIKNYKGDFLKFPNADIINKIPGMWKKSPVSWACDVGVTDKGETIIVECNDVMSLGLYGLSTLKAGRMIVDRWEQIHYNKSL